jgi:hypothetical protein
MASAISALLSIARSTAANVLSIEIGGDESTSLCAEGSA